MQTRLLIWHVRQRISLPPPIRTHPTRSPECTTRMQTTLEFHWGKHHAAYVNNLNGQIKGKDLENMTIEEVGMIACRVFVCDLRMWV
jgi:hypothetical protein